MNNKDLLVYSLLAILLVVGAFAYTSFDQVDIARAQLATNVAIDRQPAMVQGAVDFGITLTVKIIAGVVGSLVIAVCIFAYQAAQIRTLKQGGWGRFWERRQLPPKPSNTKKPSLTELVAMMIAQQLGKK